jgi:hypothetical protein
MKTNGLSIISAAVMVLIVASSGTAKAQARDIWDQFPDYHPPAQGQPSNPKPGNYFDQFDTPTPSRGANVRPAQNAPSDARSMHSANDLLPYCKYLFTDQPQGGYNVGFGVGLCAGMIDGIGSAASSLPDQLSSCQPAGVTRGQEVQVVVAYVEARPERMHEDMYALAIEALHHAWPCSSR